MSPTTHPGPRRQRRRAAALAALLGAGAALVASGRPRRRRRSTPSSGSRRWGPTATSASWPSGPRSPTTRAPTSTWRCGPGTPSARSTRSGDACVDAQGLPVGAQLRISDMGPDGDPDFQGTEPDVAYNPRTNEYLVAWEGWDLGQTPGEGEVFVQRLSAAGAEVGANDLRISTIGPDGDTRLRRRGTGRCRQRLVGRVPRRLAGRRRCRRSRRRAGDLRPAPRRRREPGRRRRPAHLRHGARRRQALQRGLSRGRPQRAHERVPRRLGRRRARAAGTSRSTSSASTAGGAEIGANDQRISETGSGAFAFQASAPSIAANERSGDYLVAWEGDDSAAPRPRRAARSSSSGSTRRPPRSARTTGASRTWAPTATLTGARRTPSGAYDFRSDEYLVAWMGWNPPELALRKDEVFAQRLDAAGAETGANDMRVSSMGADDDPGLQRALAVGRLRLPGQRVPARLGGRRPERARTLTTSRRSTRAASAPAPRPRRPPRSAGRCPRRRRRRRATRRR